MQHRQEIDGLRALAVLPVILFHAGFPGFDGGFVGVDVFFVISGYLITAIILAERQAGTFSLMRFYERRARRILPALFLVMAVCIPLAWVWLMPQDMKRFSQSLVAVPSFASNLLFWKTTNYFDGSTELQPLLHTWSLAVEEQFYMLFPMMLLLGWAIGQRRMLTALVVLGLLSLAAAHWGSLTHPAGTFYLLPTRGWELLLGVFVAFHLAGRNRHAAPSAALSQAGSLLGLGMILAAVVGFDHGTPFPSLYTLLPTVGTALIILFATGQTWVARLLSLPLLVGIGLISYSAYLWHQPLFAFARHRSLEEPGLVVFGALTVLTLLLAWLSWRHVERPFRHAERVSRRSVLAGTALAATALAGVGLAGHASDGFPSRFDTRIAQVSAPPSGGTAGCASAGTLQGCRVGDSQAQPHLAVIGDSHSYVLERALSDALSQRGQSARLYSDNWCAPLVDVGTDHPAKNPRCRAFMAEVLAKVAADPSVTHVVLVAEWANYTRGRRWNDAGQAWYTDAQSSTRDAAENVRVFERGVRRTLAALQAQGKHVTVVKSVPEYEADLPKYVSKLMAFRQTADLGDKSIRREEYQQRNQEVERAFRTSAAPGTVHFVEPLEIFCPGPVCRYMDEAHNIYYVDGNHLSDTGARLLMTALMRKVGS